MEIVSGVHWLKSNVSQCYFVVDEGITLIDTGMPHKTKTIVRYITEDLQRTPSDLKTILLTHCDIDHIGNASQLRDFTGAKIAAHPQDAEIIAGKKKRMTPKGGMSILFNLLGSFMRMKPFNVDILVNEGDNISGFTVLHMPGHTPGSIALYDSKRKVLFIGDTLGCKDGIVQGPSKNVTIDMKQAYRSIEKLSNLDFTVMLSGHGDPLKKNASSLVTEFIEKMKLKNMY